MKSAPPSRPASDAEAGGAAAGQRRRLDAAWLALGASEVASGGPSAAAEAGPEAADQFECTLAWLADEPMLPGRGYRLVLGAGEAVASITELKYRLDPDTRHHVAARTLAAGELAVCNLALSRDLPFDAGGRFSLFDARGAQPLGVGRLHFALRRAQNIQLQSYRIGKVERARLLAQQPTVLWFTGLSGAGKSTIADRVEQRLHALGRHCMLLDGDNLRHGLNRDLGFSDADRVENIRRVAEVARLLVEAGLIVITAFISPFRAERRLARERVQPGEFVEVHVDVPLAVAEARDPKGLYAKARRGELARFTGIDSPYEPPERPELHIDTTACDADAAAARVVAWLHAQGRLTPPLNVTAAPPGCAAFKCRSRERRAGVPLSNAYGRCPSLPRVLLPSPALAGLPQGCFPLGRVIEKHE
jgi:bifunctional enzyme CysN/CysC